MIMKKKKKIKSVICVSEIIFLEYLIYCKQYLKLKFYM